MDFEKEYMTQDWEAYNILVENSERRGLLGRIMFPTSFTIHHNAVLATHFV
jgi:hypothetical protein